MKKTIFITILLVSIILAGCQQNTDSGKNDTTSVTQSENKSSVASNFRGTKGDFVEIKEDKVTFDVAQVNDGKAHYFYTNLPNGNAVYFFIVKSPDGKLRAAANGCQVCGDALEGFRQEGDFMVCNTCGNSYPLNKIATEKGGCNPAPISPDLKIEDGKVSVTLAELQDIERFF